MDKRKTKQQKRNKQLYNKIYQFNKKIDKLQNDELISQYLPEKLNYNDYKNMDGRTQRGFINALSNFTKRGGENLTENKTRFKLEQGDVFKVDLSYYDIDKIVDGRIHLKYDKAEEDRANMIISKFVELMK